MFTVCCDSGSPMSPNGVQSTACVPLACVWVAVGSCSPLPVPSSDSAMCCSLFLQHRGLVWALLQECCGVEGVKHLYPLARSSLLTVLSIKKSLCSGPCDSPAKAEGCRRFSLWKGEFRGFWVTRGALASEQSTGWAPVCQRRSRSVKYPVHQ